MLSARKNNKSWNFYEEIVWFLFYDSCLEGNTLFYSNKKIEYFPNNWA